VPSLSQAANDQNVNPGAALLTGPLGPHVWARLTNAAHERDHPMRLLVMATCSPDCNPAARLMTLRGADAASGRLWFHTDRRAPKVADLRSNPVTCLVAFDPRDGLELRLTGRASVLDHGPEVERHWDQTAIMIRHLYASPTPPGEASPTPDPRIAGHPQALPAALTRRARENFAVIEAVIDVIDWYQILDTSHSRAILRAATAWRTEYITSTA
jgi:pyridoxamine 5'-phosphate oxidase